MIRVWDKSGGCYALQLADSMNQASWASRIKSRCQGLALECSLVDLVQICKGSRKKGLKEGGGETPQRPERCPKQARDRHRGKTLGQVEMRHSSLL